MIDTTALFGSAAPEPSPPANGSLVDGGFMATLGDVLAGMLDPEGLGLVKAISGRPEDGEGDGGEAGEGAPQQPTVDAPDIDASRLASALGPATLPVSASGSTGTDSAPERDDVLPAAGVQASPATADSNGLGLLDPDGDLSRAPAPTPLDADSSRTMHATRGTIEAAPGTINAAAGTPDAGALPSEDGMRPSDVAAARTDRPEGPPRSSFNSDPVAPVDQSERTVPETHRRTETPVVPRAGRTGTQDLPLDRAVETRAPEAPAHRHTDRPAADLASSDLAGRDGAPSAVRETVPLSQTAQAAPTSPRSVATAPLVERLVRAIEQVQNQPPPRSFVVEIPEFDGLQIRIAVRHDGAIHLAVPGDRGGDQAMPILDAARAALTERGFDMAHDSPNRRQPQDRDDSDLPRKQRQTRAPEPRGLRI